MRLLSSTIRPAHPASISASFDYSGSINQCAQQGDGPPPECNRLGTAEKHLGCRVEMERAKPVGRRHSPITPEFGDIFEVFPPL